MKGIMVPEVVTISRLAHPTRHILFLLDLINVRMMNL